MNKTCKDFNIKPCGWCSCDDDLWTYRFCSISSWVDILGGMKEEDSNWIMMNAFFKMSKDLPYLKIAVDNYFPRYKDKLDKLLVLV